MAQAEGFNLRFGFAITTLGPHRPVQRLLESLSGQLRNGDWVVISAVGGSSDIQSVVQSLDFGEADVLVLAGPRGASAGRNFAVNNAPSLVDWILFPNDTSWFPGDFVSTLRTKTMNSTAAGLAVVDEFGPKFRLPPTGTKLSKRNVWSVIEPGLMMDHHTFKRLGGFDESIGTGASSPWQSGEGTELLVRWMETMGTRDFDWVHTPVVLGISDAFGLNHNERRRKLRAYARGYGRLLVTGRFDYSQRFRAVSGGLSFGMRKGHPYKWNDGLWVLLGRLEGIFKTPIHLGTANVRAVDK